jgi:hypothetical protein
VFSCVLLQAKRISNDAAGTDGLPNGISSGMVWSRSKIRQQGVLAQTSAHGRHQPARQQDSAFAL